MAKYKLIETKVNSLPSVTSETLPFMHTISVQEHPQSLPAIAAHCNFYYCLRGLLKLVLGKAAELQQNYI